MKQYEQQLIRENEKETRLRKNQMSRINGISNTVLPNTIFNRIT